MTRQGVEIPVIPVVEDLEINSRSFDAKSIKKAMEAPSRQITDELQQAFKDVDLSQANSKVRKAYQDLVNEVKSLETAQVNLGKTTKSVAAFNPDYIKDVESSRGIIKAYRELTKEYMSQQNDPDFMAKYNEYQKHIEQVMAKKSADLEKYEEKSARAEKKLNDIMFGYNPFAKKETFEKWDETEFGIGGKAYEQAFKKYQTESKRNATLLSKFKAQQQAEQEALASSFDYGKFDKKAIQNFGNQQKILDHYKDTIRDLLERGVAGTDSIYIDPENYVFDKRVPKKELSNISKEFNKVNVESDRVISKIGKLSDAFNSETGNFTNDLVSKFQQMSKLESQILKLIDQINERNATGRGLSPDVASFRKDTLMTQYKELGSTIATMLSSGSGYILPNMANSEKDLAMLNKRLEETKRKLDETTISGKTTSTFMSGLGKSALKVIGAITGVNLMLKLLGKNGKNGSQKAYTGFERLAKSVMQLGFGFRSLYYLIKQLRTAITTELGNMAQQIPEVNAEMSAMMTCLNQLKGSLGTAFQPILSIVIPVLQKLTSWLVTAMNAIGSFFATLSGQGKIYKFVGANIDAAASLDKTGKSAKDAKEKLDLLSFDKINKLSDDSDSGSGGGAGAGAQGQFVEDTANANSRLAELIKEAWALGGDFTKVGEYVGTKWLEMANRLNTEVLPKLDSFVVKSMKALGTFITGVTSTEGLGEAVGENIARIVNIIIHGFGSLLDNTNIETVGRFFGELLGSAINNIDIIGLFHDIGSLISAIVKGGLSLAVGFVETLDWYQLGYSIVQGIGQLLRDIDWAGIVSLAFELLGAAIGAVISLAAGLVQALADAFRVAGNDTIQGFFKGIVDALKNVGKWIIDNIFTPFITGFKNAFGIASPSKIMMIMGKAIIDGLKEGLKNIWESVSSIFSNLRDKITEVWNTVRNKTSDTWSKIKDIISERITSMRSKISSGLSEIHNSWTSTFSSMQNVTSSIFSSIGSIISNAGSNIANTMSRMWNTVSNAVGNIISKIRSIGSVSSGGLRVTIPHLAKGAVIPPNNEFLAVLGDQNKGTNIETPLQTMIDAFNSAIAQNGDKLGGNGNVTVVLEGDAKRLFKVIRTENERYTQATGEPGFAI